MSARITSLDLRRRLVAAPDQSFPIQRRCTLRGVDDQFTFACQARDLLSTGETGALEASDRGLLLLAQHETALERLTGLVQAVYEDRVDFGPAEVRFRDDGPKRQEPYMALRVDCRAELASVVAADLRWHDAMLLDARGEHSRVVLRATAPLTAVLGYARRLERLDPEARMTSWLAYYAPADEPPPPDAA